MLVCAHQSALFELTFNPNTKSNLYGRKIICSVLLEHKKHSTFPFVTSVTVIGIILCCAKVMIKPVMINILNEFT